MSQTDVSGWLPNLIGPVVIAGAGTPVLARPTINFTGTGVTVADNPGQSRTDVTFTGGGGSTPTGTGIPHVVSGVQSGAASLIVNADVSASAAIASSKVVQATGTGIPHVVAGVLSAASSLIVNADVDPAAAIAGSKVAPAFGAQVISTTSGLSCQASASIGGATVASTGTIRLVTSGTVYARNAGNSGDNQIIGIDGSNNITVGDSAAGVIIFSTTNGVLARSGSWSAQDTVGTGRLTVDSTSVRSALAITGDAAPYAGLNGTFSKTLTAAQSYDLANTEYAMSDLQFVSNGANVIRLPPVAANGNAYFKFVQNVSGGGTIAVKDTNNVAAAATLASGAGAWFRVGNGTVRQVTAAFTVA